MITSAELQQVSQYHHPRGQLISVYLPLAQDSTDSNHNTVLKNLLRDAEHRYEAATSTEITDDVEAVLEEIRLLARDDAGRYGRGIAMFATPEDGIVRALSVPRDIEPFAIIDERPHLAPLIRLIEDYNSFCTCLISRDHARIFLGWFDELEERSVLEDEEVPGQHDQGGWSQARFERHIEDHVHRHFKRVAQQLFMLLEEKQYSELILAGPQEVVAGFREFLHPYVEDRVVGELRMLMESNINHVREQSMRLIADSITSKKGELIAKIRDEALGKDLGVQGLADSLIALQRGQIQRLAIDGQVRAPGIVCAQCGALSTVPDSDGACPYCGGDIQEIENLIPVLITRAFQQGAEVSIIDDEVQRDELAKLGGIGALLRFRVEQQQA